MREVLPTATPRNGTPLLPGSPRDWSPVIPHCIHVSRVKIRLAEPRPWAWTLEWWWGVWHLLGKAGFHVESTKDKSIQKILKSRKWYYNMQYHPLLVEVQESALTANKSKPRERMIFSSTDPQKAPPYNEYGGTRNRVSWKKSLPTYFNLYLCQSQIHFIRGPRLFTAMT